MPKSRGARRHRRTMRRRGLSSSSSELGMAGSLVGASALFQGTELQPHSFQEQQQQSDARSGDMFTGGRGMKKRNTPRGCANDIAAHILCFMFSPLSLFYVLRAFPLDYNMYIVLLSCPAAH